MASQLDPVTVQNYADRYAEKLCDLFFDGQRTIQGEDLKDFANVPQVNFLTIKLLFDRWQKEVNALKSPYFDYRTPSVQDALRRLMNLLSRNISMERADFEPLLAEAVFDTIHLIFKPESFWEKTLNGLGSHVEPAKELRPAQKYLRINADLTERIISAIENRTDSEGKVGTQTAFNTALDVIERYDNLDSEHAHVHLFNEITELRPRQLLKRETVLDKMQNNRPNAQESDAAVPDPQSPEAKKTDEDRFPESHEPAPTGKLVAHEPAEEDEEETHIPTFNDRFKEETEAVKEEEASEPEDLLLAETDDEDSNEESLNDRLRKEEIASDTTPLAEMISINERISFIENLFEGNATDYENAISTIDKCSDAGSAMRYVKENFMYKYDWNFGDSLVKDFFGLISNKF